MLAKMVLSQHWVLSSKTVRPRAPCGACCMEHDIRTWSAVCYGAPNSQLGERTRLFLRISEWNLLTPDPRQLHLTQAVHANSFHQDQYRSWV